MRENGEDFNNSYNSHNYWGVLVYSLWLRINYRETWKITETPSTYIVKTPSIDDFVSIGIAYKLNDNGLLTYTSDPY